MRLNLPRLLFVVLSITAAIWLLESFSRQDAGLSALSRAPGLLLVGIIGLKVLVAVLTALRFRIAAAIFSLRLSVREWAGLSFITTLYGYLVPAKAGNLVRAVYLKKHHDFDYLRFLVLLLGANMVEIATAVVFAILFALQNVQAAGFGLDTGLRFLALLLLLVLGGMGGFSLGNRLLGGRDTPLARLWRDLVQGIMLCARSPGHLGGLALVSAIGLTVQALVLQWCFLAFSASVALYVALTTVAVIKVSALVSVTPGNIGITEGVIVGIMVLFGVDAVEATQAAILSRVLSMLVQLVLGLAASYLLLQRILPEEGTA